MAHPQTEVAKHLVAANLGNNCLLFARELHLLLNISTLQLELLRFRYFRFGFGRFLAKKTGHLFFYGFGFSIQKMSIALHITFIKNDQTYYFASNHTPDGQHCYVRL